LILLIGGTSETASIATTLSKEGFDVLVSTATDNELDVGADKKIERRRGKMNEAEMVELIKERSIDAVVDAAHPFAEVVRATALSATGSANVPLFRFLRAKISYDYDRIVNVANHDEAAVVAFDFGKPVFLTTGSRNLLPYANEARKSNIKFVARVLEHEGSLLACKNAGLTTTEVITGRGPFSVQENVDVIKKFGIGVIVSKDSGKAGGLPAKVESAKLEACDVVLIKRPLESDDNSYSVVSELASAVVKSVGAK